jgi:hypothetical protein
VKQFILVSILCGACAAPSAQPLRYPALPPAPSASNEPDAFDPAPALGPLALACREAELPVPNALDDDCDGSIDAFAKDTPLLIAISFPRAVAADLALAIRSEKSIELPLVAANCPDTDSFCTTYVETKNLQRGRHALLARHTDQGAHSGTYALAVSVQSRGKVTTYLTTLTTDVTEQSLGAVALP